MSKVKILVADDDSEDHMILLDYLADNGIDPAEVHFVLHGKQAVDYLVETEPSMLPKLVVLDVNMPIMNGIAALYYIKQHPDWSHIPVVMYSTSNNESEQRKCLDYGAEHFFVKPSTTAAAKQLAKQMVEFVK